MCHLMRGNSLFLNFSSSRALLLHYANSTSCIVQSFSSGEVFNKVCYKKKLTHSIIDGRHLKQMHVTVAQDNGEEVITQKTLLVAMN